MVSVKNVYIMRRGRVSQGKREHKEKNSTKAGDRESLRSGKRIICNDLSNKVSPTMRRLR